MSDIQFVQVDAKEINNKLVKDFEEALGDILYPGDERRIFLDQETQVLVNLKNLINETGKQNLLRYARNEVLDALGERIDTVRLTAQKAKVTLRFTLSAVQGTNTVIPQGTRVSPDGRLYFATIQSITIAAGQLTGDVIAEAVVGGKEYNNFAPGQIKTIVDPIPFVASVTNLDTSTGGSDVESDENYRERIRQAPSKYSTAGAEDAYIYWAMTADVNIQDVKITSPNPAEVRIIVLMKDGQLPTQQTLDAVITTCSYKNRRPLTDYVTAVAPTEVSYNIQLTYYISKDNSTDEVKIRSAIEDPDGIIDQYRAWQRDELGRAINPDYLRSLMYGARAFRVDITSPAYTQITVEQVAKALSVTINYGGLI